LWKRGGWGEKGVDEPEEGGGKHEKRQGLAEKMGKKKETLPAKRESWVSPKGGGDIYKRKKKGTLQ